MLIAEGRSATSASYASSRAQKFSFISGIRGDDDEGGSGGVHAAVHAEILQRIIRAAMVAYRLTHA